MKAALLATSLVLFLGAASALAAQTPDGKTTFEQSCRACHGTRGIPSAAMVKMMKVPNLDAGYFAKHNEDSVVVVLKKGRGTNMKSFTGKLTPDQMQSVAHYIRELATSAPDQK